VHRGVPQPALAPIEGQAVFAVGAMGNAALAVDGATRMRLAELATLVPHEFAGSSRICTSAAGFALRIGGCWVASLGGLAHLLRLACCAKHVPLQISMGERWRFDLIPTLLRCSCEVLRPALTPTSSLSELWAAAAGCMCGC